MIYFREKNIVIITPPHVASGNLHKALCTRKHGGTYVIGPTYNNIVDHHYARLHTGWEHHDIKTFLIVRNPFDRLIGLFLHYNEFWPERRKNFEPLEFRDFVMTKRPSHWIYRKTISQFVKDHGLKDFEIIRYEGIEDNISKALGKSVSLRPAFHDPNDTKEWYSRKDVLNYVIKHWAQEDCDQFSYGLYGVV